MINKPGYRIGLRGIVIFLGLLCYFAPAIGDEATEPEAKYSTGANQCMSCHREGRDEAAHEIFLTPMGISGSPKSPFADGARDCETCHGPSANHRRKPKDGERPLPGITYGPDTPVHKQNEVCLGCHSGNVATHWTGSVHEEEELACADCHNVHAAQDPVMDKISQQEVCFACHQRTRAETFRSSSHPLRFGSMTCTDCHNPHDSNNDFLLTKSTINDTCYTCHAEKRGPYLWEHAPVTEDCSLCHRSHGSNHAALLKQRSPLLCQQCHSPAGHPAMDYTPDDMENSFQQRFLLGRSCDNCHTQVHGSNHPSGVIYNR